MSESKKILIVDDSPVNVQFLKYVFEEIGIEPEVAYSAAEARKFMGQHIFDLCFIDYHMPDENGASLILSCSENSMLDQLGRVFIITADTQFNVEETGLQGLIEGIIHKPVDIKDVEKLI